MFVGKTAGVVLPCLPGILVYIIHLTIYYDVYYLPYNVIFKYDVYMKCQVKTCDKKNFL